MASLREEHEADAGGGPLLVALEGGEDVLDSHLGIEPDREPVPAEDLLALVAQVRGLGKPQRRQQADRDRLAVAVAAVAAGGLDRAGGGVAGGGGVAEGAVALVGGDERAPVAGGGEDKRRGGGGG